MANLYTGIVKPHYRLLGMLLERQELRMALAEYRAQHEQAVQRKDATIRELERQIALLDVEILTHQQEVHKQLRTEGRSMRDLQAFIGDDLFEELTYASRSAAQNKKM